LKHLSNYKEEISIRYR